MSEANDNGNPQFVVVVEKKPGLMAGIFAIIAAILAMLFLAIIFLPIAIVCAITGTIISIKNKNGPAIAANAFAWALILAAMAISPSIWILFGAMTANM